MTSIHRRRLDSRVTHTAARIVEHATREQIALPDLAGVRLPWYEIRNADGGEDTDTASTADTPDVATVLVFDEIGGTLGVNAKDFVIELDAITAPTIHVRINSHGGALFDAVAIHNALRHHPSRVVTFVDSLAASAASIVAMGGDEIVMMPGSQMMIHDASALEDGNASDHGAMATFLDRQSDNIADIYQRKGGGEAEAWRLLMLAETWMFASEAVELGLADRVQEEPPSKQDERMARAFDLTHFRYAGRRAAPAPPHSLAAAPRTVRRQPGRAVTHHRVAPEATPIAPSLDYAEAAERRAEAQINGTNDPFAAVLDGQARSQIPGGPARCVSTAWQRRGGGGAPMPELLLQTRKAERDGKLWNVITGYATVYERDYEMWDVYGPYREVVTLGAGEATAAANPDTIFLVNHRGLAMARTHAGTLTLRSDDVGFADEAWVNPSRSDVKDLVINIDDKVTTEQSFAFMIVRGKWSPDYSEYRIDEFDVDRGDVSAVNFGANPYTSIAARGREILDELQQLPASMARAALYRLSSRADLAQMPPVQRRDAQAQMPPSVQSVPSTDMVSMAAFIAMAEASK